MAVIVFSLAILWLVAFAGGKPAYDPDGANALHVARNIADGEGIVSQRIRLGDTVLNAAPLVSKPPLYPLGIGLLTWLGLPPEIAGWAISAGAWAAAAALLFLLARRVLPLPYALLVPCFFALQVTALRWGITIHEESLFVALNLAVLWRLSGFAAGAAPAHWGQYALIGALAALAMLASYQGVPLILAASAYVLIYARRDGGVKQVSAFAIGMGAVAAWPFLRFVSLYISGVRPGFDVSAETAYYKMLAGIVASFQNDLLGKQVVWLYNGSLGDVLLLALFYSALAALLIHAAWRRRELRPVAAFFLLYLVLIVAQLGGKGKPEYEPRYNLPLYGLFFLFAVYSIRQLTERWKRPLAGVGIGVLALILFACGQSPRYSDVRKDQGGICPAPQTISWLKRHIPRGSVIAAPQCGHQLIAESNAYYWLAIPPAGDVGNPVRWDEADYLSACKFRVGVWIALLKGEKADPFLKKPGYGPFFDSLLSGRSSRYAVLAARLDDGLVFKLNCPAAGGQALRIIKLDIGQIMGQLDALTLPSKTGEFPIPSSRRWRVLPVIDAAGGGNAELAEGCIDGCPLQAGYADEMAQALLASLDARGAHRRTG